MANTTLQIRHSTVQGNTPSSLANGEIAINSRDGVLYYSTPSGTVTPFTIGPSGLNTEIQFNDAGSVGGSEKLTFNKTTGELTVNGTVRANIFSDDGVDLYDFSNRAFTTANAAFITGNSAFIQANAVFLQSNNNVGVDLTQNNSITVALNTANAAFTTANSAASTGKAIAMSIVFGG